MSRQLSIFTSQLAPGTFSMKIFRLLLPFFWIAIAVAQPGLQPTSSATVPLRDGWALQSSAKVTGTGEDISGGSFKASDWIKADVPTTVVAAQVKGGLLPDPFYGMNLQFFEYRDATG
jgi:exo-1,4-beta-D-glucosaminidase